MGAVRTSSPRFRRAGTPAPIRLTEDDISIMRHVHRHRFVRADDIYRLFPERSPDKLSRRLTWLYRHQFLDRPIAQIDRFKSGGSQSLTYGIDAAGARFLREHDGAAIRHTDWKARNREYTRENLEHTLAVSRFMIDLELACLGRDDVALVPFERILVDAPEVTRQLAQPGRWPVILPWHGNSATVHIAPDAIFGLEVLQGGDELILDGLLGETAPAGPLEAMLRGGLGKVALLEPLPPLSIAPRGGTVGLQACPTH